MKHQTTEAFCRLVTALVEAIESNGGILPADIADRLADNPLKACELLNELALAHGAIDESLDAALADIYESMDAEDARRDADAESVALVLGALEHAHREPAPEPEPQVETGEPEPAEEPKPRKRRGRKPRHQIEQEASEQAERQGETAGQAPEPVSESRKAKLDEPAAETAAALTVDQAAAILGVNKQKVYKLIETKKLPAHKKGRSWQIAPDDLAALQA